MASKFLLLQESVRDAADLYLSLRYPPPVFICDTPCTFTKHMDIRSPNVASLLWSDNSGCFEKPVLGHKPSQVLSHVFSYLSKWQSKTKIGLSTYYITILHQYRDIVTSLASFIRPYTAIYCFKHSDSLFVTSLALCMITSVKINLQASLT